MIGAITVLALERLGPHWSTCTCVHPTADAPDPEVSRGPHEPGTSLTAGGFQAKHPWETARVSC